MIHHTVTKAPRQRSGSSAAGVWVWVCGSAGAAVSRRDREGRPGPPDRLRPYEPCRSGGGDVFQEVIAERRLPSDNEANTDGNRHLYGFECENLGDGADPWPGARLEAIEEVSAAICRHHGWGIRLGDRPQGVAARQGRPRRLRHGRGA
ncbi:N-acetylmuramoyl-L-alanine amidase [Streptomyces sp. NPDC059153]|uniref:peptidoglycan recognition protein family protein n=1 Tax=Streptomyces sp. NPDC059153 TaxID=3346743 RepID=UPI00368DB360